MEGLNTTTITEFILLGITDLPWLQKIIFVPVLIFYLLDILGNLTVVFLVFRDISLHSPMYFLLANLSFVDICFSSVTVPKMMVGFWKENKISFEGCIAQMYFFHFLGCTEGIILASMGYDRYIAICHPLRYNAIMGKMICVLFVLISWLIGLTTSLVHAIMTSKVLFCGKYFVNHYFCDVAPLLSLSCGDITLTVTINSYVSGFTIMFSLGTVVIMYINIIITIMKLKTNTGRRKAFSTCSSHITVVTLYCGTAFAMYSSPKNTQTMEYDKMIALVYTMLIPFLNPVIYSLRNREVMSGLKRGFQKILIQISR
ncbi:unnamed protein product [Staurois parvus]|uniref:Olfactory receptor n=1 Tax=Staurois parvus TaxID=386267 RepID=A0ABN9H996_9NEOB|nr:unnamed protein product [Staurois parvus]